MIAQLDTVYKKWKRHCTRQQQALGQAVRKEEAAAQRVALLTQKKEQQLEEIATLRNDLFCHPYVDLELITLTERHCTILEKRCKNMSKKITQAVETFDCCVVKKRECSNRLIATNRRIDALERYLKKLRSHKQIIRNAVFEEDVLETWQAVRTTTAMQEVL